MLLIAYGAVFILILHNPDCCNCHESPSIQRILGWDRRARIKLSQSAHASASVWRPNEGNKLIITNNHSLPNTYYNYVGKRRAIKSNFNPPIQRKDHCTWLLFCWSNDGWDETTVTTVTDSTYNMTLPHDLSSSYQKEWNCCFLYKDITKISHSIHRELSSCFTNHSLSSFQQCFGSFW